MKITYEKANNQYWVVGELPNGAIFRPKNSLELYMVTNHRADDEIINSDMAICYANDDNIQNFDYDDCPPRNYELIGCINIPYAELHFFHQQLVVELLDCELIVKEND